MAVEKRDSELILTDGGFATQLTRYIDGDKPFDENPLWSAAFNLTHPKPIYEVHRDFLKAGADLIRTNTYQASVMGYRKHLKLDDYQIADVFKRTIRAALDARDDFDAGRHDPSRKFILVLVSIGPYGAYLADGSEYNGNYVDTVPAEEIREFHRQRLDVIAGEPIDGLAIETIPSVKEAEIIVDLLNELYPTLKFWISFNCQVSFRNYLLVVKLLLGPYVLIAGLYQNSP